LDTPSKIRRGMNRQLLSLQACLTKGHRRLGWKVGFNLLADQQRLGLPSLMTGYLTTERFVASGARWEALPTSVLLAEPEVAVQIGRNVGPGATAADAGSAIEFYAAALELVDTTRSVNDDIEEILAGNMFHEAVLIADKRVSANEYSRKDLKASLSINGVEVRTLEQSRIPQDFGALVAVVANILATHGEQLKAGDWIITGAATKAVAVHGGDRVGLDMGQLGTASLVV